MSALARLALGPADRAAALACLAGLALAGFVLTEPLGPAGVGDAPALLPRPAPATTGAFMQTPPFDRLRRPLGGVGQLPSEAPPPAPVALPPPEPPLSLSGILFDSAHAKALFGGVEGWQEEGAVVQGWTISRIEPRRVTLHRGEEHKTLDASDAFRP